MELRIANKSDAAHPPTAIEHQWLRVADLGRWQYTGYCCLSILDTRRHLPSRSVKLILHVDSIQPYASQYLQLQ